MNTAGVFAACRKKNSGKALILMYHRFSESETPHSVSCSQFEKHLEYLTRYYNVISLKHLAETLANRQPLPPRTAVITIDDGYADVFQIAFPLLKKFNTLATVFAVTDFLDRKIWLWTDKMRYLALNSPKKRVENQQSEVFELNGTNSRLETAGKFNAWLKKLPDSEKDLRLKELEKEFGVELPELPSENFAPFSWDEARRMDAGGVAIESHTVTHPILTSIDAEQLNAELTVSRQRLESELNREIRLFCYPNGNCGEREELAAQTAGYVSAVSTEFGFNETNANLFALKRYPAEPEMNRFVQATSGFDELKKKVVGGQ